MAGFSASPKIVIVVPCLDEHQAVVVFHDAVTKCLAASAKWRDSGCDARILFVDDGSTDGTWDMVGDMARSSADVSGVRLSRNFGQQPAVIAGYEAALRMGADAVIAMDVDLQDDPAIIPDMVDAWRQGADIVFGVRSDRSADGLLKRFFANAYHGLTGWLGVPSAGNASEFSLMSRRAVEAILGYGERDVYLRGVRASLGFETATVSYVRGERAAGEPAYTFRKSMDLALSGVFSYSRKPLSAVSAMAAVAAVLAVGMLVWTVVQHATGMTVDGWSSTMASLWAIGAMVLASMSIACKYIGNILMEVKGRPRYIVMDEVGEASRAPAEREG